jgi:hypothetical protein
MPENLGAWHGAGSRRVATEQRRDRCGLQVDFQKEEGFIYVKGHDGRTNDGRIAALLIETTTVV